MPDLLPLSYIFARGDSHEDEDHVPEESFNPVEQPEQSGKPVSSETELERTLPLDTGCQTNQMSTQVNTPRNRWFVHHQVLEHTVSRRLDLLAILRIRFPQLFQRTESSIQGCELYALTSTFDSTLFGSLRESTGIVRAFERQAMVQALVVRMAFGMSPPEMERQSAPPAVVPSRRRPAVAEFYVPVPDADGEEKEGTSSPPKRVKIQLSFVR